MKVVAERRPRSAADAVTTRDTEMNSALRSLRRGLSAVVAEPRMLALTRTYDRGTRLPFDLSGEGRRSRVAIRALHDVGRGQRCFILGNGPSLASMDLSSLREEVTFGLNRVHLLFDKIGFATTYLVAVNHLVIEQSGDEILAVGRPTFMSWHSRRRVRGGAPIFLPTSRAREFSKDPALGIWEGATVTFVALQLAYYMGFDPVILIGVDHSFATKGSPHKEVTSTGDDPNHFDPRYFGKGFRWNLPDLETSEVAYRMARAAFEADGRRVIDATVGGKLSVFPKADFSTLVAASGEIGSSPGGDS